MQKNGIGSKNIGGSLHERAALVFRATLCSKDRTCQAYLHTHIPEVLSKVETYKPHACWATTRTRVSGACTICGRGHGLWKQWYTHTNHINHPHPKSGLLRMHCIPPFRLPHPPPPLSKYPSCSPMLLQESISMGAHKISATFPHFPPLAQPSPPSADPE